LAPLIG